MEFALGTAQLKPQYGVANKGLDAHDLELKSLLGMAWMGGIRTLDTAPAYGEAEIMLGQEGVANWRVISKLPPLPATPVSDVYDWVVVQVVESLSRLKVHRLNCILMHRPQDLIGPHGTAIKQALVDLRSSGVVQSLGFSIYDPQELVELVDLLWPDVVQAPFNILDRRILSSGWCDILKQGGVEVHARSVFLQGLLLMPSASRPSYFDKWSKVLCLWDSLCTDLGRTKLDVALSFVADVRQFNCVLVGLNTLSQLEEVLGFNYTPLPSSADLASQDLGLIDPSNWRL